MSELHIQRCQSCQAAWFPNRLRCPSCGDDHWRPEPAGEGVLEQATELRRAPDTPARSVRLGSVRLDAGPVVIARLPARTPPGARVHIEEDDRGALRATETARR